MFSYIRKNSKIIPEKKLVKVIYNDGKCPYCNTQNYFAVTNDGGSISHCLTCNKIFTLFKYVEEKQENKNNVQKDNYDNFLNKTPKPNNAFI